MSEELKQLIDGKVNGEKLSIVNLDGGAAVELIDEAIADCLRNAADINTKKKVKREVTFKLWVIPQDDGRSLVFIDWDVPIPKLAGRVPISEGNTYDLRVGDGGVFAKTRNHSQKSIFDNVTPIKKEAK